MTVIALSTSVMIGC